MSARARVPAWGLLIAFACLAALCPTPAAAAKPFDGAQGKPSAEARAEARRFGLDQAGETVRRQPAAGTVAAVREFRRAYGASVRVLFHPRTGAPEIVTGFEAAPRSRDLEAAARQFLDDNVALLGVRTSEIRLTLKRGSGHALFQQVHEGLPVEFSRIGVHLDRKGLIHYIRSDFDPAITASPVPGLREAAAREAASRDIGSPVAAAGSLVYLPVRSTGETRLAW